MKYQELLKSPLWQKKRLEIFNRDGFACRFCGSENRQLHVHHLIYLPDKYPWEYSDEYLITLCDVCHSDEELLKSEDRFLMGNILLAGIGRRELYSLASSLRTYFDCSNRTERFLALNDFLNG